MRQEIPAGDVAARAGWGDVPAVRDGHLYEIKSSIILQPGPAALTDGLRELQRAPGEMGWRQPRDPRERLRRYLALVFAMISGGSFGRRRLLVPVQRLEVVAHELLVEGGRADALAIGVRRPEARGIAASALRR